jgi:hypothetical protein
MKKEKTRQQEKRESGLNYFIFALLAFAGLGLEVLIAFLIEPILYGLPMDQWGTNQFICHWILICIIWCIVTAILVLQAKSNMTSVS